MSVPVLVSSLLMPSFADWSESDDGKIGNQTEEIGKWQMAALSGVQLKK
jgi:hypothetical protein